LKLGGVIQQGLIGYITIGIDPTVEYDINAPWSPIPANVQKRMQKTEL
jgi:hypothetical protein